MRRLPAIGLTLAVLLLAGCTPQRDEAETDPTPSGVATQSRGESSAPQHSASPGHSPSPESSASQASPKPDSEAELSSYLLQRCADEGDAAFGGSEYAEVHFDRAMVEQRDLDPRWFVYIPVTNTDPSLAASEFGAACLFDQVGDDFVTRTALATVALSDHELELWLTTNETWGL
jgi:hypothetical protein